MPRTLTAEQERLVMLAIATYSSHSTYEVAMASQEIRKFIIQNYPKSFSKLQQLIIINELQINVRKSIISHIKTVSLQLRQQLQNEMQHNPDILSNNKKLLHDIEHILTNKQLQATLKQPIAEAYVSIFVLFMPQTYDKLFSKAKYYLNTKQDQVALNILQSYHYSKAPFKYKYEFYSKLLPLLIEYILQKIKVLNSDSAVDKNKQVFYLNAHLSLLAEIWRSMNFQKYESIFCKELSNQKLYLVFQMLLGDNVPLNLLSHLHSIAQYSVNSLRRTSLYRKYQKFCRVVQAHLTKVLNKQMQSQFLLKDITEDYEVRSICADLKFLISSVDVYNEGMHLLNHNFRMYDIYTKLVYPNFKNIQKYLYKNSNNPQEIFSFLYDISFEMKSECPEVLIQKFTCSLAKHSKVIEIRSLIYSFLFAFLPKHSNGKINQFRVKFNLSQFLPFWSSISTFISLKQQLLSILALTALSVTCFLNDIEFLTDLNDFMGKNAQFFLTNDTQVQFFSLLIYRNYRADIFSNNKASNFKGIIFRKSLQSLNFTFNRKFILAILQEQFQEAPNFDDLAFYILTIVNSMVHAFDKEMFQILFLIFKNYQKNLLNTESIHQITTHILSVLENWTQQLNHFKGIETYFQMIGYILASQNYQFSSQLFAKIMEIVQRLQKKTQIKGEIILGLMLQMLKKIDSLPQNIEVGLCNLKWQFQTIEVINSLTELLKYSQNHEFLNWIVHKATDQEFSVYSALLLQNLVYYKSQLLNYQSLQLLLLKIYSYQILHPNELNYVSGKLNIVCLFLLRHQKKMVYNILLNPKWREIQAQIKNQAKVNHVFIKSGQNTSLQLSLIDQFYHLIYYNENAYRWKYDIEVFLITQLTFFQTDLNDQIQLTYANLAMVACITNAIRAYSYLEAQNHEFIPETEGEEVNCRQLDFQYKKHLKMIQKFNKPEEFNQDYFSMFRNWINELRRTHQSNKWLKTIVSEVFSEEIQNTFEQILHIQKCGGQKLRNIVKVQRIKRYEYS